MPGFPSLSYMGMELRYYGLVISHYTLQTHHDRGEKEAFTNERRVNYTGHSPKHSAAMNAVFLR